MNYAYYAVNVIKAIGEFENIKETLLELSRKNLKLNQTDKVKTLQLAEAAGFRKDDLLEIIRLIAVSESDIALKKMIAKIIEDGIKKMDVNTIRRKVAEGGKTINFSLAYNISVLDCYLDYLKTEQLDDELVNKETYSSMNNKIQLRIISETLDSVDFYSINKDMLEDYDYINKMSSILNKMDRKQLQEELILVYRALNNNKVKSDGVNGGQRCLISAQE